MGDIRITRKDAAKVFTQAAGSLHVFKLSPLLANLLEVEDVHFHHDSAVLLPAYDATKTDAPPKAVSSMAVLCVCYRYAKEHPEQKILVCGHTDTSGDAGYNVSLSELRSENVVHILTGDRAKWVDVCKKQNKVEDHQQILKWVHDTFGWETDPGPINNTPNDKTKKATKEFQKTYNIEFSAAIGEDGVVGTDTWGAFFDVYMLGLMDLLETDEDGLQEFRKKLQFIEKQKVGCGENWPIEEKLKDNYRSPTNRRVEILFFDLKEEPALKCHPGPGKAVAKDCLLYTSGTYTFTPIPVVPPPVKPPVAVSVELAEIAGLYKPGYNDPEDDAKETTRAAGFKPGYKSEDDKGRIFLNAIPRTKADVDWDTITQKNKQFIELTVVIKPDTAKLPASARVVWEWEDPDDPSNEAADMRDDAGEILDPNDYSGGKKTGANPDDNIGLRDFPKVDEGTGPEFEEIDPYTMSPLPDDKQCQTIILKHMSKVRFHCTNVGGDNFRIKVKLKDNPKLQITGDDKTGLMTMWKRVDVEYRKMEGALDLPVADVPPYFEKAFVQMDFTKPLPATKKEFMALKKKDVSDNSSKYVKKPPGGVFEHESKPGWFLLVGALLAAKDVGTATPKELYKGTATLAEKTYTGGSKGEVIIVPAVFPEEAASAVFEEGGKKVLFGIWGKDADKPAKGQTTLHLDSIDFQSEFKPGEGEKTGLIGGPGGGGSYDRTDNYYPGHMESLPGAAWTAGGYGFGATVNVAVSSPGAVTTAGISPENKYKGSDYFAGRTIIFTKHPSSLKPAKGVVKIGGAWAAGDTVTVTVGGTGVTYTAGAGDTTEKVAAELRKLLDADATVKTVAVVKPEPDDPASVELFSVVRGEGGNLVTLAAAKTGAGGTAAASGPTLTGGGVVNTDKLLTFITHEFTHAFGFPHKCGYYSYEKPATKSCSMNYFHNWLYKIGTKTVQRFDPGIAGPHLCALHLDGLRKVHMEDNPAMWKF